MKPEVLSNDQSVTIAVNELSRYPLGGVFVLTGEDGGYKKRFRTSLEDFLFPNNEGRDFNYTVLSGAGDSDEQESVVDVCRTGSFGAKYRVAVVEHYDARKDAKDIVDYCEHPSRGAVLILTTTKALKDDPVYKEHGTNTKGIYYIDVPAPKAGDIRGWLTSFFRTKEKSISHEAVDYLVDHFRLDFETLRAEAVKIADFHADKSSLDVDAIRDFTHVTKMDLGFEFCDSVLQKDAARAYTLLRRMDKEPIELLGLLLYKISGLYYLSLFGQNADVKIIAKTVRMNAWALGNDRKFLRSFRHDDLRAAITGLQNLSRVLVSRPKHQQRAALDAFIFSITRPPGSKTR